MTLVGDLHGQLEDLYTIFTINGLPSLTNKYLFNGDFVDRGKCGAEVVMTILLFKLLYPEGVFLNRGNHESRNQNSWMGFEDEIWEKYDGSEEGEINRATKVCGLFQVRPAGLFYLIHSCVFTTLWSRHSLIIYPYVPSFKRKSLSSMVVSRVETVSRSSTCEVFHVNENHHCINKALKIRFLKTCSGVIRAVSVGANLLSVVRVLNSVWMSRITFVVSIAWHSLFVVMNVSLRDLK